MSVRIAVIRLDDYSDASIQIVLIS
ncbi:hypothetical protein PMI35_06652, partial [Pseudomonas sp. GM78]